MPSEYSDEKITKDTSYWENKVTSLGNHIQQLREERQKATEGVYKYYKEWLKTHSCDCELQGISCKCKGE